VKSICSIVITAVLASGAARAQWLHEQPVPTLKLERRAPFSESFQPYPRTYAVNEADNPNHKLFRGLFKTDPQLLFGVTLAPNLALEAGHVSLADRGFHAIDPRDPRDTAGALDTANFSAHAAVRVTLPLSERLSVYGKLGVAHSQVQTGRLEDRDTGPYLGMGAKLKVDPRTSVDIRYGQHGDAGKKWGSTGNSSGLKADLKMGF
jgi:hypothetical protein